MKTDLSPIHVILFEGEGADRFSPSERVELTSSLLDRGYSVQRISEQGGGSTQLANDKYAVLVLGRFHDENLEIADASGKLDISTCNASDRSVAELLESVETTRATLDAGMNQPGQTGAWKPWFPVIDYDRCTNCMQCLSFCLFDVYGVDDEKQIQVQNNDNCKTNCPACSRVCPEVAIMFPKYGSGPINGEPVNRKDVERESMKVDITSLLGGDIYSSLRTRSEKAKSRFSKERSPDKALNERKRCMVKLQQSGIIPPEVLAELDLDSLPSPEAIQQKAKELAALQSNQE
ncbi:MAG: Fe-S cluster protein [Verrucomicrobiales bacterium]|nr:Fe-S cluster protein [Verrucomicrobiales bacterium]